MWATKDSSGQWNSQLWLLGFWNRDILDVFFNFEHWRNNICTWGWGWEFQLNTETEVPLHQANNQILSLVKSTVCARRSYTFISFRRLLFRLPWLWCAISFRTLHVFELRTIKGTNGKSLTSCSIMQIRALRRMSSFSPFTALEYQSDLCLSMSFTQDNNSTSFTDLLWSRRS